MAQCRHCFREKDTGGACPFCGYDERSQAGRYPLTLAPGTILNGRYTVGHVIGQGGFGITYIAQDYRTKERVAVKEYLPTELAGRSADGLTVQIYSGDREENYLYGKEQFLAEAKTLASFLGDEHIVRIHSYFEENGTAYFVMEYVDGLTLDRYMAEHGGRLAPEEAGRLLLPLMESLGRVHEKGIVHRDIAPDNIIVSRDGSAKLIDFGAARYSTGEKSRSLDVILKHGFAPYEQYMRRGRQGPWTDVYALAATYYYAVTGKIPPEAVERITDDRILAPSALGVQISPAQEDGLFRALEVNAPDRIQNMAEFRRAMEGKAGDGKEEPRLRREEKARPVREDAEKAVREAAKAERQREETGKKKGKLPLLFAAAVVLMLTVFGVTRFAGKKAPEPAAQTETSTENQAEAAVLAETDDEKEQLPAWKRELQQANIGSTVSFGAYEQDNNEENGREPIEWEVLDKQGDRLLVISTYALDCLPYNTEYEKVTWETCSLRVWLNKDFLTNAFTEDERAMIPEVTVTADEDPDADPDSGYSTQDRVFLLSVQEVKQLFNRSDEARRCTTTAYVNANGSESGWWWLRSSGTASTHAPGILGAGGFDYSGNDVDEDEYAVRPAMWIETGEGGGAKTTQSIPETLSTENNVPKVMPLAEAGVGDIVVFGVYEQDNNQANGKEEIEWLVLAKEDRRLLVVSRYALDCMPFDSNCQTVSTVTWKHCTLRTWLNESFLDEAFTKEEKNRIQTVTVSTDSGSDSHDRVFLLSVPEVEMYFESNEAQQCEPTAFAKANGCSRRWWLRSPGANSRSSAYVYGVGSISRRGIIAGYDRVAVRPAVWIEIGS